MRRYLCRLIMPLIVVLGMAIVPQTPIRAADQPKPSQLFDLTVSLEWQPGKADSLLTDLDLVGCRRSAEEHAGAPSHYVDDLVAALRETSAYLYRYSEGQMALRNVTIYTNGEHWNEADIRILANNSYRPTAFIGGITKQPLIYVSPHTGRTQTFYPGAIFLGRLWNGQGARCGAWSQPAGVATIGHEWGHYGLFLWDEYFNQHTHAAQYCTSTGAYLPAIQPSMLTNGVIDSVMAYHYRADKLWLEDTSPHGPPATCVDTPQWFFHGASDWNTIPHFYPAVVTPPSITAGPSFVGSPAAPFFTWAIPSTSAPADTSAEVWLAPFGKQPVEAQTYVIRPVPGSDGRPLRILAQGTMLAGEYAAFWGVLPGDRALVVAQDHTTGDHVAFPPDYHGAGALDVHTANTITMTRRVWRPELTITSVVVQHADLSEVTGLQVRLHDHARATERVQMAYCPAGSDCDAPVDVSLGADGIFDHTFSFPVDGNSEPPAAHGYIYVRAPETGEETVAWYQRAGGIGPATIDGHAPLLDGSVNVDQAEAAVRSDVQPQQAGAPDTHVLYSPAGHGASTGTALPSGVLGIIGTPWYVQPVIANREGTGWGPNDPPLRVRLSYNQDLLDRLGIDEEQLVVLRLNREGRWEPAASQAQIDIPVQRSRDLDWIVVTAQQFNGEGEVYALAYTPFRMRVPVVQRP